MRGFCCWGLLERVSLLLALLFVLFDIEVFYLYPGAVVFREKIDDGAMVMFWAMISFELILFIGYLYALKKGALEWKH